MNNETILLLEKYFDVAFAAPDGVKKLRELILSLAMQGKLVPQDPRDQSARELLKEIEAEKSRLVKDGKIKASKPLPEIKPDEVPYDLPKSWEWMRLGESVNFMTGKLDSNAAVANGIYPFFTCAKESLFIDHYAFDCEAVLLAGNNAAGKYSVKHYKGKFNAYQRTYIITVEFGQKKAIDYGYLKHLLENMLDDLQSKSLGTLTRFLTLGILKPILIPLPPLAEQRRIVAKIDELMARCDELEKLRQVHAQKQITVHNAALNQLLTAKDHNDFKTSWHFITQHFGELYSVKANVTELRKAILQLAVMGKLVPQDPNDQPASELLKEIEVEKNRLVKEEGLRTSASEQIEESEKHFGKFEGWEYCRLGNLAKFIDYRGRTPTKVDSGIALITAKNVRSGYINREPYEYVTQSEYQSWMTRGFPKVGDILFTTEAPLGNIAIIDIQEPFALAQRVICLQLHKPEMADFLKLLIMSSVFQNLLLNNATGMTATGIKASRLKEIPVPLPSLAEQHRIVAKIDQLMTLCDDLEKQIDITNSKKTNLLNSVMTKV